MEKVKGFFRELNENRKYQIVFFVLCMCVILGGYIILRNHIVLYEYQVEEDVYVVKFIEVAENVDNSFVVSGWCFYKDFDSKDYQVQVFLRNLLDEEDIVWLETEMVERSDIDEYYGGIVDYSKTGFRAICKNRLLTAKDYEIFIKFSYAENRGKESDVEKRRTKTVTTRRYISNGLLTAFKSEEGKPKKVASEELNNLFNNGQMLIYRKDVGMYVYQYKGKLYWVADENFQFEDDQSTYIQYHLTTTRPDKLPLSRIEKNWYFDNLGFNFEDNEIKGDFSPYRVTVADIPTSYPVMGVKTGYYSDSNWVWQEDFNLDVNNVTR